MEERYLAYLEQMEKLSQLLEEMSELARKKLEAVQRDDLMELDGIMKQEQAHSMALRGFDHQRDQTLKELGLTGTPLSQLAEHYPTELCIQARAAADRLRSSYEIYQARASAARSKMESELHLIGAFLENAGAGGQGGPGYTQSEMQPPKPMKTDFRA